MTGHTFKVGDRVDWEPLIVEALTGARRSTANNIETRIAQKHVELRDHPSWAGLTWRHFDAMQRCLRKMESAGKVRRSGKLDAAILWELAPSPAEDQSHPSQDGAA